METLTGQTLQGGKYLLREELGRGGFGITYKAVHLHLNQTVVIKTLNEALRNNPLFPDSEQKFQDEARRLALCAHPNIVRVSDFFTEDDRSYIVMDYVPGQTLDKVVTFDRPLPEALAVHYIRQIGAALRVVHHNGLLHRDLKPQNMILRSGTQEVVLIDFGIAREFEANLTQTHTSMISSGYAPIEQYLPQARRTPATDVYALAATLYALLTGRTPMASILRYQIETRRSDATGHSANATEVLTEYHQPMPSPRQVRPDLSLLVDTAVMRGMALDVHQRPASVDEWLALLPDSATLPEGLLSIADLGPTAVVEPSLPIGLNSEYSRRSPTDNPQFSQALVTEPAGGSWLAATGAVVLLAAIGLGSFWFFRSTAPAAAPPASSRTAPAAKVFPKPTNALDKAVDPAGSATSEADSPSSAPAFALPGVPAVPGSSPPSSNFGTGLAPEPPPRSTRVLPSASQIEPAAPIPTPSPALVKPTLSAPPIATPEPSASIAPAPSQPATQPAAELPSSSPHTAPVKLDENQKPDKSDKQLERANDNQPANNNSK